MFESESVKLVMNFNWVKNKYSDAYCMDVGVSNTTDLPKKGSQLPDSNKVFQLKSW